MSGESYHRSVREYLEGQGWRVSTTDVDEGVSVLAGTRDGSEGSSRMLTMVVEEPASQVGSEHLKFLLKAGREKDAGALALTTTIAVPEAVRAICEEYDVSLLDPATVRSAVGGQNLGAGVADISMPDSGQPQRHARQQQQRSQQQASQQQPPQQQPPQQQRSKQQPDAQSPAAGGPSDGRTLTEAGGGTTDRRKFLLGGAGVVALAAGGWYFVFRDDSSGELEATAQAFVTAVDNRNRERVNELIAEDGEMEPWTAEDASYTADNSYEMTDFEVVERDGDVAEVDITMRVSDGQVTETTTVRYELHRIDGDWKFWAVLGQPNSGVQQTQAEQTGEQSTAQVVNNVEVTAETGAVNSAGNGISMVRLTVQRAPGSGDVDLSQLSIQYVGDNGTADYAYAGTGAANAFHLVAVTAQSPGDTVLTDDDDRYQVLVPFDDPDTADPAIEDLDGNTTLRVAAVTEDLGAGASAELELTTGEGATRNVLLQVPETIADGSSTVQL